MHPCLECADIANCCTGTEAEDTGDAGPGAMKEARQYGRLKAVQGNPKMLVPGTA